MHELKSKTQLKTLKHIHKLLLNLILPEQKKVNVDALLCLLDTEILKYQNLYAEDLYKMAKQTLKKEQTNKKNKSKPIGVIPHANKKRVYVNRNNGWTDCNKLNKETLVLKPVDKVQ